MKTYALLVGLNKYQDKGILTLGGCVNDINRFEQYLLSNLKVPQAQILKLLDDQAPKAKIIEDGCVAIAEMKGALKNVGKVATSPTLLYRNPLSLPPNKIDKFNSCTAPKNGAIVL